MPQRADRPRPGLALAVTVVVVLGAIQTAHANVTVLGASGEVVKTTSAAVSHFGPRTFNTTLPVVEAEFTGACKAAKLKDTTPLPVDADAVVVVVAVANAMTKRCQEFSTMFERVASLLHPLNATLGAVVFVRAFTGPPEAQTNYPTLIPGTLWVLRDDKCVGCEMVRVPSVTVRYGALDGLLRPGAMLRVASGDDSEWDVFFESRGGLAWRWAIVSLYLLLLLWTLYGLVVDHKRHGNHFRTMFTNIPEATQLTLAVALLGCVLVFSTSPTHPYVNRVGNVVMYDVPYFVGVFSLMIFFSTWDLMVRAFDKSRPDLEDASAAVYKRFRTVAVLHFTVALIVFALRFAFPNAQTSRLVSNVQYTYCGGVVIATTARVVVLGRRLNRLVRKGSWEERRTDSRPFIRMQRLARRLCVASFVVLVTLLSAVVYTDRFALVWHVVFQSVEAMLFTWVVVMLCYHLHVARTNIGKNMDARASLAPA